MTSAVPHRAFCLVGKGIVHSLSPLLHQSVFDAAGFPWVYQLNECADERAFAAALADPTFSLYNITTPYKRDAYMCADEADEVARFAGGANVVVRSLHGMRAYNVDGIGCAAFLARAGVDLNGARVAVCGTGPTARAIVAAFAACGAHVFMLSRTARQNCKLDLGTQTYSQSVSGCSIPCFAYGTAEAQTALTGAQLVVNATPLGMAPHDPAPFDTQLLQAGQTVLDAVYGHGETALLRAARHAECRCFDGTGMLVGQAVETVVIAQLAFAPPQPLSRREIFDIMESCVQNRL